MARLTRLRITEAIRYLDLHTALPDDSPPELRDSLDVQLSALLLNSALAALRAGGGANARLALRSTDRALSTLTLNDTDKGASLSASPPPLPPSPLLDVWDAPLTPTARSGSPVLVLVRASLVADRVLA